MSDFPSWWKGPEGELKHITEGPIPEGWGPAGGHYDYALGVWIEDEKPPKDPFDHDGDGKPGGSKKRRKAK